MNQRPAKTHRAAMATDGRISIYEVIEFMETAANVLARAEKEDSAFSANIRAEFAPRENSEVPLVITSPGGILGLHYTLNTVVGIKGMTKSESDRVFAEIDRELLTEKYIYDHMYQQDNDICLFDNSITLHRRRHPGNPNRLAYRVQYYPNNLITSPWHPYKQKEYYDQHQEEMLELKNILELDIKFP
jgi:alpha-ketoglutarate-dependent taurine dioxygenase